MKTRVCLSIASAICGVAFSSAVAANAVSVDWRKTTIGDLDAARAILLQDSPGSAPGEDAAFVATLDHAYEVSTADAHSVSSYAGYRFALEHFANTFQDDHLWVDFDASLPARWPGFMVGYRNERFEVVESAKAKAALLGAQLLSCDGIGADTLADRDLPSYSGRWTVPSSRREVAPLLLIDRGNPFISRPVKCGFDKDGRRWRETLAWSDIAAKDLQAHEEHAQRVAPQPREGVRASEDGGYWIGIPTLNALNPHAVAGLESLMKEIEAKAPSVRASRYFVIDLRGNSGGNTFVALRVLDAIWGAGAISEVRPKNLRAEWRASQGNLAYLQAVAPMLKQMFGETSVAYTGLGRIIDGFRASLSAGRPLYVDADEYSMLDVPGAAARQVVTAKPFVLTDNACVSSCLNLVDLVLKLPNVTQIGDETASDTYYLENRPANLPSGKATLQFPIKRYRNRERLSNQSYKPARVWPGGMADTPALEHWVATLTK
jgi:hypothetical protein